jgi:hypothetical protein
MCGRANQLKKIAGKNSRKKIEEEEKWPAIGLDV